MMARVKHITGTSLSDTRPNRAKRSLNGFAFTGDVTAQYCGIPNGYRPPYTWLMAQKDGGIATYTLLAASGTVSAGNLAGGRNVVAALDGVGIITGITSGQGNLSGGLIADGSLSATIAAFISATAGLSGDSLLDAAISAIGELDATAAGTGTLAGDLEGILAAIASLSGTGTFTADVTATGNMEGSGAGVGDLASTISIVLSAIAAISGTGSLSAAAGALSGAVATLTGTGTADASVLNGIASMSASLTLLSEGAAMTEETIATAVLAAITNGGLSVSEALTLIAAIKERSDNLPDDPATETTAAKAAGNAELAMLL